MKNKISWCYGLISILSFCVFIAIGIVASEHSKIFFDMPVVRYVYEFRNHELTPLMFFFSYLGKQYLFFLVGLFYLFLLVKRNYRTLGFYGLINLLGVALYFVGLELVKRARPVYLPLDHEYVFSFPSGHTLHSTIFFTTLTHYIATKSHKILLSIFFGILCFSIVACIAVSRVYLGVHFPSDVLAGFSGGIGVFSGVLCVRNLRHHANNKK